MSGLTITRIDPAEIDVVREALQEFKFKPLSHLPYLKKGQVLRYWRDEITETVADASSATFVAKVSDRIAGFSIYAESPWDTRVIGRRIGVVKHLASGPQNSAGGKVAGALVEETLKHAAKCGIECLTTKVHPQDTAVAHALERSGFQLMDTLLYFVFDFSWMPFDQVIAPRETDGLGIRLGTSADLPQILEIAERAFKNHFGRYNADPKMPSTAAKDVYQEWAHSAFSGWADWVTIAEVRGSIAGYVLWRKPSALESEHGVSNIDYNLVAIHPRFVGRGVYAALTYDGMRRFRQSAKQVGGFTHVTHRAVHQVLFELSWRISGARHSFHKWLMS